MNRALEGENTKMWQSEYPHEQREVTSIERKGAVD